VTLVVVAGPTGSGKTDMALQLALRCDGEIVNYDSVQVYRGFDIGSAKPGPAQRSLVPHHMFDVVEADHELHAAGYAQLARTVCDGIESRGRRAILVGGTFFYLRALLSGLPEMPGRDEHLRSRIAAIAARPGGAPRLHRWLSKVDPQSGGKIAAADRHRVERALEVWITTGRPISSWDPRGEERAPSVKIALSIEKAELTRRLDERVAAMFAAGLVDETRSLLERYPGSARPFDAIGYREAAAVVRGTMTESAAIAETQRRTRGYAKRQMTWLRSERNVHWVDATRGTESALAAALRLIEVER